MVTKENGLFSENALKVLEKRYLLKGQNNEIIESPREMFVRISQHLAEQEKKYGATQDEIKTWENKFFNLMWDLDFMANSPTLMNAGTGHGTLSACYVLDIEDSMQGIMTAASEQAMIEKFGGGIGFSLSDIRPLGDKIKTTHGKACGPIAVLNLLSEVGTMITQGGKRDGAHMAIMSVYHPNIKDFITCKTTEGEISNFNISVGADANFMKSVKDDKYIKLAWPLDKKSYSTPKKDGEYVKAREIFSMMIDGAWLNGEPGMVWLDKINEDNTTPEIGQINATNPCGEQPLLSGESCNLGSINLGNFIEDKEFQEDRFIETIRTCVRFLDNVIDANNHPTDKTIEMNSLTRKIGLGLMGWADLLIRMNIPYDSDEAINLADRIGSILQDTADRYSSHLGKLKGNFPAFDKSILNIKNGGKWETMRNAWRLSIAPTGTISMISNCSSGIEPLFGIAYKKHNMSAALEGVELFYINEDLKTQLDDNIIDEENEDINLDKYLDGGGDIRSLMTDEQNKIFVESPMISPRWHVKTQAVFQKYVDSGISKTINMPNEATKEDVEEAYTLAWELGCKGITVYRAGSREKEVLVSTNNNAKTNTNETSAATSNDTEKVLKTNVPEPRNRPSTVAGVTEKIRTGHGNMYVTVNFDQQTDPFEVFTNLGKAGSSDSANLEAVSRLISLALRSGIKPKEIVNELRGISDLPVWDNGKLILSAPDAVAQVLAKHSSLDSIEKIGIDITQSDSNNTTSDQNNGNGINNHSESKDTITDQPKVGMPCPECHGSNLIFEEGCLNCHECGYSKCG
jgi:ribonucleoside-diphosphate reductase alpha chain